MKGLAVLTKNISIAKNDIADFCRRHGIRKLSLFGSLLRDDFGPESDVDVLVEFEPDTRVGLFKLYDLEQELSGLLGGRRIDINTPKSLSKHFREEVLAEAEVLYGAA
jgi:predicted nucleotidyltransferase